MNIEPIAYYSSPLGSKFGVPRQAGLATALNGQIRLEPGYARSEALAGLGGFSHLWLIWGFHLNSGGKDALTVRPPRLGGNRSVGVFASRSPFRPNGLGLSAVRIENIDRQHGIIGVSGADLADGTPIYDIKPYLKYSDSIADAEGGYTDCTAWKSSKVFFEDSCDRKAIDGGLLDLQDIRAIEQLLSLDPRPRYQDDPLRSYGMEYGGCDIRFQADEKGITVKEIIKLK